MAKLVGLQKYMKGEDTSVVECAISMLNYARRYKDGIMTEKGWQLLKDLICDPEMKDIMAVINDATRDFNNRVKAGQIDMQEQEIVKGQIESCNAMINEAVKELQKEGKIKLTNNNTKSRKLYSIKTEDEENQLTLK